MKKYNFFSIITICYEENDNLRKLIKVFSKENKKNFELIIISEKKIFLEEDKNIKFFQSLSKLPPQKRDFGVSKSVGDIIIFLDDDSFPDINWFDSLIELFKNPQINVCGGPAEIPTKHTFKQKIISNFYSNKFTNIFHYLHKRDNKIKIVDEINSVNFAVRKEVFLGIGGFGCDYWPGEDTFICKKIKDKGIKIFYSNKLKVYHYPRKYFFSFFKQIYNYSKMRGYFIRNDIIIFKKYIYFLPSIFFLSNIISLLLLNINLSFILYFLLSFLLFSFSSLVSRNNLLEMIPTSLISFISLNIYGFGIIRGYLKNKNPTNLGR